MTGTPLDLTPFGPLVKGIGLLYWVAAGALVALALWWFKRWWLKVGVAVVILATFVVPAVLDAQREKALHEAARAKFEAAKAHFEMRCASAGERVAQTVKDVEGILLIKVRPSPKLGDDANPMWPGAAMFKESAGEEYIRSFLGYERLSAEGPARRGQITRFVADRPGYKFVDVIDSADGQRRRYTAPLTSSGSTVPGQQIEQRLRHEVTTAPPPQYGVTFEDIVDPRDREHWVAGTSVRVVELKTDRILAELTLYAWDPGIGSTAGFRAPWAYGRVCPARTSDFTSSRTRHFVDRVLQPSKGN